MPAIVYDLTHPFLKVLSYVPTHYGLQEPTITRHSKKCRLIVIKGLPAKRQTAEDDLFVITLEIRSHTSCQATP